MSLPTVSITDLKEELWNLRRLYDTTCQDKQRLARLVDQCRSAMKAARDKDPDAHKLIEDRLGRCDDYIRGRPERDHSRETDNVLREKIDE